MSLTLRSLLTFICFAAFLFSVSEVKATHFRAGEITAKRISGTTYEIKLSAYFDVSPDGKNAADAATFVDFYFGTDGPRRVDRDPTKIRNIGNNTTYNEYITTYTFPSTNAYQISVRMENRNANTLNLN